MHLVDGTSSPQQPQILLFNFVAGETPYQCKLCAQSFANATALGQHCLSHSMLLSKKTSTTIAPSSSTSPLSSPDPPPSSRGSPKKKDMHSCFCGKNFPYLSVLEAHMRSHTGEKPFKCSFCEKAFAQKATLQVHERVHTGERPYKCKFCEKTFAQYGTKTVHEKSAHLGQKNYKCPTCAKCLSSPSALYTHKKTHGQKSFQCEYCPKAFVLKNYLKLHIKQVHQQSERHHLCPHCGKTFAYAGSLQVHIRTHTGERPYKCRFCPKAFASQGNLQSHERTHTGERPYVCKLCNRGFVQKSQLTAHEGSHHVNGERRASVVASTNAVTSAVKTANDYVCKYCGKRYAYASSLYVHTRLHTGERPFKCRYCNKAFTNQGNMQVHERVHTGERPYKCPACDKSYAQKVGLKIHLEQCQRYLAAKGAKPTLPVVLSNHPPCRATGEKEQKKRRLEDLLPKLFNGRFKSKAMPNQRHIGGGSRGTSTDSGASTPLSSLSGGSVSPPTSLMFPFSSAFSPFLAGVHPVPSCAPSTAVPPSPLSLGEQQRLAATPPSFDFTTLLAIQSVALANLRSMSFGRPATTAATATYPFCLPLNSAAEQRPTTSHLSPFDYSKLLPFTANVEPKVV